METVDISIVVVTYNRAGMLKEALETLVNQETEGRFFFEIIVVDDGSTDNTAQVVREVMYSAENLSDSAVKYIYQNKSGIPSVRNTGVQEARGQWIAFFDDDQLAEPEWLAELYRVAQARGADCVDGPVYPRLPASFQGVLGPRIRALFGEKFVPADGRRKSPKDTLGTNNVLVHRSVFAQVGGFDTAFDLGSDADFFARVEKGGFKICYSPKAVVYHVIPASRLRTSSLRTTFIKGGLACARISVKYGGPVQLTLAILRRVSLALGRDIPLLAITSILRHHSLKSDSLCALWHDIGFFWGMLFLVGFAKENSFDKLLKNGMLTCMRWDKHNPSKENHG